MEGEFYIYIYIEERLNINICYFSLGNYDKKNFLGHHGLDGTTDFKIQNRLWMNNVIFGGAFA
jgi:hypothetical protein